MIDDDDVDECWEAEPLRPLWWRRLVALWRRIAHRCVCWRPSLRVRDGQISFLVPGRDYCRVTVDAGGRLLSEGGPTGRICTMNINGEATVMLSSPDPRTTRTRGGP